MVSARLAPMLPACHKIRYLPKPIRDASGDVILNARWILMKWFT
jgi:hypothetical protein